jgi:hypothetical protein
MTSSFYFAHSLMSLDCGQFTWLSNFEPTDCGALISHVHVVYHFQAQTFAHGYQHAFGHVTHPETLSITGLLVPISVVVTEHEYTARSQ